MPVDSKIFKNTNDAQWRWYNEQYMMDDEDKFEVQRDLIEYNASFSNPEAVRRVREARENTYSTDPEKFNEMVTTMFGRKLNEGENIYKNENNVERYLNLELDEIKFIPIKE